MGNLKARITATVLAGAVFAGSLMPCHMANGYQKDGVELKPGIYQQLDNVYRMSPGNPEDWVKSGNYSYEFLDSEKRYITIRKIEEDAVVDGKLVVPKEIDGYPVLGVGIMLDKKADFDKTSDNTYVIEHPEMIRELILPEGMEFLGLAAFDDCLNIEKISMPDSLVWVSVDALSVRIHQTRIPCIKFPHGVYAEDNAFHCLTAGRAVIYSDCVFERNEYDHFGIGAYSELRILYHKQDSYTYSLQNSIKKMYVGKKIKNFTLYMDHDDDGNVVDYDITKLIMNGKTTGWMAYENMTEVMPHGGVRGLYTVKGAKAIKTARKFRVPYYWKKTGKTREVKGRRKNGKYKADWKKTATKVMKNTYDFPEEKWKTKPKTVKTEYKVYGKKTKNGTYKLLKTTTKNSIKSEYKYIKAVPVKTWD